MNADRDALDEAIERAVEQMRYAAQTERFACGHLWEEADRLEAAARALHPAPAAAREAVVGLVKQFEENAAAERAGMQSHDEPRMNAYLRGRATAYEGAVGWARAALARLDAEEAGDG